MNVKIEKGIEYRKPLNSDGYGKFYDILARMDIGDSFFISERRTSVMWITASSTYSKKTQTKFSCRAVDFGWRLWRVK